MKQTLSKSVDHKPYAWVGIPLAAGRAVWHLLRENRGINAVIIGGSIIFIGMIWVAILAQVKVDRQDTITAEIRENSNLVTAFEEHTTRTIKSVDAVAQLLQREYARVGPAININPHITSGLIDIHLVTSAGIVNEHGDWVVNSVALPSANVADREYFRTHLQSSKGLYVAKPEAGQLPDQWVIYMTRRISKPDGSFGGIAIVGADPAYLTNFYKQSDLGDHGLVTLAGLDGFSRARRAGQEIAFGDNISTTTLMAERAKNPNGNFLSLGKRDNIPRFISYRTLADYSLVVAVGTAQSEVLESFLLRQSQYYSTAMMFNAVIILFTGLLVHALNRQKRAVAALADSAAQFRATFEQAAVGIAHTGLDRRYLMINQKFCDLLGYTRDELLTMRSNQIAAPDDQHVSVQNERALSGEINTYSAVKRYIRKDGSTLWANRTVSVARDANGKPLYFIRVIEDITERVRAEEAVKRERALLRAVVDAIPERIYVKDREGRFLLQNATNLKVRGITNHDEIVNKTVFDVLPYEVAKRLHAEDQGVMESGRPLLNREGTTVFGSPHAVDGDIHWHLTSKVPLKDDAGNTYGLVGVNRDITDLKRAEAAMRHLNEELEAKVIARTSDLERARHDAEEANRAKSSFLAAMSHEIRTPMNGVVGMIDVLHQSSLRGEQVEMVELIRESAFSLLGIINDILDFSKIEAGKLEIEHEAVSVTNIVESVCSLLNGMAEKNGVALTLFTDPNIPEHVLGDTLRLRQILINLASNAIKFSSGQSNPGKVSVRALMVEQNAGGVTLEFQVTDNGIGMDEETQARLFTAFTQADASTTRCFGGTGLGLAIANNLTELMGGEITVQSAPGAGSTFKVRMPFVSLPAKGNTPVITSDMTGLSCLVVGNPDGIASVFSVYLQYARAAVEQSSSLAAVTVREDRQHNLVVWVLDTGDEALTPEQMQSAARTRIGKDINMVIVSMGRDNAQSQHAVMPGLMTVSGNNLTCRAFLEAVATAAGRTQARPETVKSLSSKLVANAPSREEAKQRGGLILIAEDNETNQKVILRQLALLGHAADVAADGRQALEYWKSGDYALLLTDLHMPKMDGYELAEAIRSAEKGDKRIPIVALTANALKEEAQRCRAVGMDDYRSKPTPLAELKVVLDKWLPATGSDAFASRSSTQSHGSVHGTVIAMPQRLRNVDATNTKTESDQHSSAERTHLRSLV